MYTHVVFIRMQLFRWHFQPTRTMECTKIRAARLFSCQKLIALLFSFVFLFRCRWPHRCLNSHNKIGTKRVMTAKIITVRRFQIDVSSICSDQGLWHSKRQLCNPLKTAIWSFASLLTQFLEKLNPSYLKKQLRCVIISCPPIESNKLGCVPSQFS